MRILFLGDIVGRPGRRAVCASVHRLRAELGLDLVLANAENASGGLGLKPQEADELLAAGVDLLTTGNHVWKYRELYGYLGSQPRVLRPANYPPGVPGTGFGLVDMPAGGQCAVINLQGRVFMEALDCPFRAADALLAGLPHHVRVVIVDFHAEASSEKIAMAFHLAGRATAVLGTHTHVQTSDARILPGATACLTDLGMCGPELSILGMEHTAIVKRFLGGLPARFTVAGGPVSLEGALVEVDEASGKALSIETVRRRLPDA